MIDNDCEILLFSNIFNISLFKVYLKYLYPDWNMYEDIDFKQNGQFFSKFGIYAEICISQKELKIQNNN